MLCEAGGWQECARGFAGVAGPASHARARERGVNGSHTTRSSRSALALSARHWPRSGLSGPSQKARARKYEYLLRICACFIACCRRCLLRFAEVSDRACTARRPRMWSRHFCLHASSAAAAPPLAGSRQTQVFVGVQVQRMHEQEGRHAIDCTEGRAPRARERRTRPSLAVVEGFPQWDARRRANFVSEWRPFPRASRAP